MIVPGVGHGGQPEARGVHPAQPAVGARALAARGRRGRLAAAIARGGRLAQRQWRRRTRNAGLTNT